MKPSFERFGVGRGRQWRVRLGEFEAYAPTKPEALADLHKQIASEPGNIEPFIYQNPKSGELWVLWREPGSWLYKRLGAYAPNASVPGSGCFTSLRGDMSRREAIEFFNEHIKQYYGDAS